MLGKLIKNDLKAGLHTVGGVYLAALIVAAAAIVGIAGSTIIIIKVVLSIVLIAMMLFVVVFTFFAVIAMFNKSVYGNPGYLTLTLPVKEWQLIFSKTLTGIIFILVSYIALIGSIVGDIFYLSEQKEAAFATMFWGQLEAGGMPSLATIRASFVLVSVLGLISIYLIVSSLHMAVTLTNVSKLEKLGMFGSIIFFFGIYGVLSWVCTKLGALIGFRAIVADQSVYLTFSDAVVQAQRNLGARVFDLSSQFFMLLFAMALCAGIIFLIRKTVNVK